MVETPSSSAARSSAVVTTPSSTTTQFRDMDRSMNVMLLGEAEDKNASGVVKQTERWSLLLAILRGVTTFSELEGSLYKRGAEFL